VCVHTNTIFLRKQCKHILLKECGCLSLVSHYNNYYALCNFRLWTYCRSFARDLELFHFYGLAVKTGSIALQIFFLFNFFFIAAEKS